MADPAVDLTDKQLGPYHIVAILGEGGMGVVYQAYEARLDRYVALKVHSRRDAGDPDDSIFVSRFWQEARAAAALEHPHILPIYTFGEHEGHHYIAMKLVRQGSLADLLHGKPLLLNQMAHIINQVGGALDYAHSRNVVHLDVKPGNILISRLSGCLLTDFGIARMLETRARDTETEVTFGTPIYMSPEQMRGDQSLDSRSDIYSLGVVLYEMATGRPPFKGTTEEIQKQHIYSPPPPPRELNSALPKPVAEVILRALAKEPGERFATAGELAQALQTAIPGGLVPSGAGAAAILEAASSGVEEDPALESDEPIDDEELTAILEASSARPSIEERQRAPTEPVPIPAPLSLSQRLKQVPTVVWVAALVLAAVVLVGLIGLGGFGGRPFSSASTPTVVAVVVPDDVETATATSTIPFIHTSAPKPTATDTRMPTPTRTVTATPEPTPTDTPAPTKPPTPTGTATPEPTPTDTLQAARPRASDLTGRLAIPLMYGNEPKVYIVTTDGELESIVGGARQPAYNGEGSQLMVDGIYGVWDKLRVLDPTGGGPYEIGDPALAGHSYPSWSPDGNMVIYEDSTVDPRGSRLFTRDLDTNGPDSGPGTQLKAGVGRGELVGRNPLWTTQDRYIFRGCNTWEGGKESDCGIWLMQGNNGEPEQLTANPNHIPTDVYGDIVAFVSPEEGDWNIYTLNLVTGATRRITDDEASDGVAAISPDGQTVAFLSNRGGNLAVWYLPITGGSAKKFFDLPADWGQLAADGWNEEKLSWGSE